MKTHASLFSGFGAPDLAASWMGWDNAFWCEIDPFPRQVLSYWFPKSIGYEDIKKTDFTQWRGRIDILTGGFPCQPFSVAGQRKGADDDRYLWTEMLRAIREIHPAWVVGENVAGILSMVQPCSEIEVGSRASLFDTPDTEISLEQEYVVETVCRDIECAGYSVQPFVIPACAVGAPHRRDRVWFVAHRADAGAETMRKERQDGVLSGGITPHAGSHRQRQWANKQKPVSERQRTTDFSISSSAGFAPDTASEQSQRRKFFDRWQDFPTQSPVCGRNDGLPFDVERLTVSFSKWRQGAIKGYGNAIVPQVVYEIFKAIEEFELINKSKEE